MQKGKPTIQKKGDWGYMQETTTGERLIRHTLRHRVRILLGVHGQQHDGEWLFNIPPSWKYPRLNRILNRIINAIPSI
jgi:hypothetical protein